MLGANARWVIAAMQNMERGRKGTVCENPTEAMCQYSLSASFHHSVTNAIPRAHPEPTSADVMSDVTFKQLQLAWREGTYDFGLSQSVSMRHATPTLSRQVGRPAACVDCTRGFLSGRKTNPAMLTRNANPEA